MERRLSAILAADVAGYSRLIRADEEGTLALLQALRADLIEPRIAGHKGRVVKLMGDGILVEFGSVVDAVRASVDIQRALAERNAPLPEDGRILFRIGVNLGDVVIDGDDIQGDGVNIAARLEGLADPGGICLSHGVFEQVRDRLAEAFEDLGERTVKNIDRPIRVWRWSLDGAATVGAATVGGAGVNTVPGPVRAAAPERPSIAVLPFDNMSGDPEQGYFADGIAEDIITDLSKVSGLFVIARNSSFSYRDKGMDLRDVCQELGVRFILEGSVRRAGNRVRINAQMIEGTTGGHIWADRFDRDLADIFAVQDEVTCEIVQALKVALTADEQSQRNRRRKVDPEAYDLFVLGRSRMSQFTAEATIESRALYMRAVARDPGLAAARALISLTYSTEYLNRWNDPGPDHLPTALAFAEEACRIDPAEPWAHHAMALANLWLRNFDAAEQAARKAVDLNPNFAGGFAALGQILDLTGRHASAIDSIERALVLDPIYSIALQMLGRAQFALGLDEAARENFERRLALTPHSDMTRVWLASIHGHAGRMEEAHRIWHELMEINPGFSVDRLRKVLAYKTPDVLDRLADGLRKAGLEI